MNACIMIWSDFEFVIHLASIIKTRILDMIWPCLLIIMIMTWLFSGILFICALVVSFAALALRARAANDTTQAQINNIPSKSHAIPLLSTPLINQIFLCYIQYLCSHRDCRSASIRIQATMRCSYPSSNRSFNSVSLFYHGGRFWRSFSIFPSVSCN